MQRIIDDFRKEYRWLSNFADGDVYVYGEHYQNREAAYQAQKSLDPEIKKQFYDITAREAKKLGVEINLREDWEEVKYGIMYDVCLAFFEQHKEDKQRLLNTGFTYLEEGNTWNDTYWGICNEIGENNLGRILMQIRENLRQTPEIQWEKQNEKAKK